MTVRAVFHIHTIMSDGRATLERLISAAKATQTDLVAITDHDTLAGKSWEGWHKHCFVLAGAEVTIKGEQHILVFGAGDLAPRRVDSAAATAAFYHRQGAVCFIAHPFDVPSPVMNFGAFPFTEWKSAPLFDGMEILNLGSWGKSHAPNFLRGYRMYRGVERRLQSAGEKDIRRWDELASQVRFLALFGLDEHSLPFRKYFLKGELFGLERSFSLLKVYLNLERDALKGSDAPAKIVDVLRRGDYYMVMENLGDATGFSLEVLSGDALLKPGDVGIFRENACLKMVLPLRAGVKIIRDGKLIGFHSGERVEFPIMAPGCYRVEVYRGGRIWVYSNPIWLQPSP
ncbi:MAG: hypothetical protein V2G42_00965 [bacterium JZ-2024 1]